MGRWFGYHGEYLNLIRIWMRDEYVDYFTHLATVEQEIRNDIYRYEQYDITPTDFAVRIQTHPTLNVTSRLKMRHAILSKASYSGKRIQSLYYKHKDPVWLENNINAVKNLIISIKESGLSSKRSLGKYLFFDVDVSQIKKFFEEYKLHEKTVEYKNSLILKYLDEEEESHKKWNVVIMGIQSNLGRQIDLGLGENVNLLNRSKTRPPNNNYAYLLGIVSKEDLFIDLFNEKGNSYRLKDIKGMEQLKRLEKIHFKILEFRERKKPNTGLLLLYPINGKSEPTKGNDKMIKLDAVRDIIAMGAYFPRVKSEDIRRKYISADLEE